MARQKKFGKPGRNRKNLRKNSKRIEENNRVLKELTK